MSQHACLCFLPKTGPQPSHSVHMARGPAGLARGTAGYYSRWGDLMLRAPRTSDGSGRPPAMHGVESNASRSINRSIKSIPFDLLPRQTRVHAFRAPRLLHCPQSRRSRDRPTSLRLLGFWVRCSSLRTLDSRSPRVPKPHPTTQPLTPLPPSLAPWPRCPKHGLTSDSGKEAFQPTDEACGEDGWVKDLDAIGRPPRFGARSVFPLLLGLRFLNSQ